MNFYNSFNDLYNSSTKQDMSVFNELQATLDNGDGTGLDAYWEAGSPTIYISQYWTEENGEIRGDHFDSLGADSGGFGVKDMNELDLQGVMVDDIEQSIEEAIDDTRAEENYVSQYGASDIYPIVIDTLAQYGLKVDPNLDTGQLNDFADWGTYDDGTIRVGINPYCLVPINAEQFERQHLEELGKRFIDYLNNSGYGDNWTFCY